MPLIEPGSDSVLEWPCPATQDKFFLRLRHTDITSADFDGDGVSNRQEIQEGADPISPDIDKDGLADEWEQDHFGNLDYDATSDPDDDGLVNLYEAHIGSHPNNAFTMGIEILDAQFDFDGDGVPSSEDPILKLWFRWYWEEEIGWVDGQWTIKRGTTEWNYQT